MANHWKRIKKTGKVTTKPLQQSSKSEKFKEGINIEDFSRLENEGGSVKPRECQINGVSEKISIGI